MHLAMGHIKSIHDICVIYSKQEVKIPLLLEIIVWLVYFYSVCSFITIRNYGCYFILAAYLIAFLVNFYLSSKLSWTTDNVFRAHVRPV